MWKMAKRNIFQLLHPHSFGTIKFEGKAVDKDTGNGVAIYISIFLFILTGSTLIIAAEGFPFETSFVAVLACFNNVGPGLGIKRPTGNYAGFSYLTKAAAFHADAHRASGNLPGAHALCAVVLEKALTQPHAEIKNMEAYLWKRQKDFYAEFKEFVTRGATSSICRRRHHRHRLRQDHGLVGKRCSDAVPRLAHR